MKKSKMPKPKDIRKSMGGKTFLAVFVMILIIGMTAIIAGFSLFSSAIRYEFENNACMLAEMEAEVLGEDQSRDKLDEILMIFESIPEEEKGNTYSKEYTKQFESAMDAEFNWIREEMAELKERNDAMNAYVAAIDAPNGRMINLIDADPDPDTFCPPGSIDRYDKEDLQELAYGSTPGRVAKALGYETPLHAMVATYKNRGTRVTGGSVLYRTDKYTIMTCVDSNITNLLKVRQTFLLLFGSSLLLISIIAAYMMLRQMRRLVVEPINQMAEAASAYSEDHKSGKFEGHHFSNLDIHTKDEIEHLSNTMKEMESDIADYESNLTRITAERERMNTELSIAAQIQESTMPSVFPVFPDRLEFNLRAAVHPAKEVGGDFYDFYLIDEDHLALVIADVSGKGVPASLYMMGAKIMIGDYTQEGNYSPAKILERVNDRLCARNKMEMFVTVWLGILEISTGKLTAANAGHEYPAICRAGERFELFKDPHGFILGGMDGIKYKEYEVQLQPGDVIFEYTDGVTEAANSKMELFGTDRMLDALNEKSDASPEELLLYVVYGIDRFVQEAPQFDDITMLCLRYNGPDAQHK